MIIRTDRGRCRCIKVTRIVRNGLITSIHTINNLFMIIIGVYNYPKVPCVLLVQNNRACTHINISLSLRSRHGIRTSSGNCCIQMQMTDHMYGLCPINRIRIRDLNRMYSNLMYASQCVHA